MRLVSEKNSRLWCAWTRAEFFGDEKSAEFCIRHNIAVKAQGEGTGAAGAFLVPEELRKDPIAYRDSYGMYRDQATVRLMASDVQTVPIRAGGGPAAFVPENVAAAAADTTFGGIGLTAKKPIALSIVSADALEDAESMGQFIADDQGKKLAAIEDDCGINGDGSPTYGGMTGFAVTLADGAHAGGVRAASGHHTCQTLDATDLGSVLGAVPEQYLPNASWYCSAYALGNTFVRLGATAYAWVDTPTGKRPLLQYGGYPIFTSGKMPGAGDLTGKLMIAFGDMRSAAILGSRREIVIRASLERYMDRDQIAFRGTSRFNINNHNLGDATRSGALAGIIGN